MGDNLCNVLLALAIIPAHLDNFLQIYSTWGSQVNFQSIMTTRNLVAWTLSTFNHVFLHQYQAQFCFWEWITCNVFYWHSVKAYCNTTIHEYHPVLHLTCCTTHWHFLRKWIHLCHQQIRPNNSIQRQMTSHLYTVKTIEGLIWILEAHSTTLSRADLTELYVTYWVLSDR